jgi:hypothetical protein
VRRLTATLRQSPGFSEAAHCLLPHLGAAPSPTDETTCFLFVWSGGASASAATHPGGGVHFGDGGGDGNSFYKSSPGNNHSFPPPASPTDAPSGAVPVGPH